MTINSRSDLVEVLRSARDQQQPVLVVGLGVSGLDAAEFLLRLHIPVIGIERRDLATVNRDVNSRERIARLTAQGATVHCGLDGEACLPNIAGARLAVLSPGISLESAVVGALRRATISLVGEFELGLVLAGQRTIAVTGSNGKSTTVSLIKHMFDCAKLPARLCGNIGTPVVQHLGPEVLDVNFVPPDETLVVEASSYQLESCSIFRPDIGVFINLSDNHLERHGSMERYFEAKANLFARQSESDWAVIYGGDKFGTILKTRVRSQVVEVLAAGKGANGDTRPAVSIDKDIQLLWPDQAPIRLQLTQTKLRGSHNQVDIGLAAGAAFLGGVPARGIQEAISTFVPLEHRLELLLECVQHGVPIINDSKSTTVAASVAALNTVALEYPDRVVVLMVGGLAKAGSWAPLVEAVRRLGDRCVVVLFGKDGRLIGDHFSAAKIATRYLGNLAEATKAVLGKVQGNEVILLSPGCASFDEFSDFEARGLRFKALCLAAAGDTATAA